MWPLLSSTAELQAAEFKTGSAAAPSVRTCSPTAPVHCGRRSSDSDGQQQGFQHVINQ